MGEHASGDDNQRTLAWLDSSLERARAEDRTGLVRLLDLVRVEVLFDVNSPESVPSNRTAGSAVGSNRGV